MKALTPAFETLYAGLPGGQVIPCFEPVIITSPGSLLFMMDSVKALLPLMTPHKLASRI